MFALLVAACIVVILWFACKWIIYERFINPTIDLSPHHLRNKLVVITGCDSGFGNQTAKTLHKMGFSVLATCLTEEGKEKLIKAINHQTVLSENDRNINTNINASFHCLIVNVTKTKDIDGLKSYVLNQLQNGSNSLVLWAIINNAGIMRTAEFDLLSITDFQQVMDVNFFGAIRVIKGLISVLRQTRYSRIINIVSAGIHNPMYAYSGYLTSKSALETFSIILRAEMAAFQCYVCSVLPGANDTNLLDTTISMQFYKQRVGALDDEVMKEYGMEYFEESAKKCIMGTKWVTPSNFDKVVAAIVDAVIRQRPYRRYVVGFDATFQYLLSYLPLFVQEFMISGPLRPWTKPQSMR